MTSNLKSFHLKILSAVKPSKPQCWMEGKLLEGGDVKMSCKSADGSDPIHYKWERVLDKGKYVGKLPPLALIGKLTHSCSTAVDEIRFHRIVTHFSNSKTPSSN